MIYNASVRVSRSTGILLASRQLRGGPPTPQTAFLSAGGGGGGAGGQSTMLIQARITVPILMKSTHPNLPHACDIMTQLLLRASVPLGLSCQPQLSREMAHIRKEARIGTVPAVEKSNPRNERPPSQITYHHNRAPQHTYPEHGYLSG